MHRIGSLLLRLSAPLLAAAAAPAQTVLFSDDFENGTVSWTMEDYWHLAAEGPPCMDDSFPSGSQCMWYGQESTCNFEGPIVDFQDLRLAAPLALPTQGGGLVFEFWSRTEVEFDTTWDT